MTKPVLKDEILFLAALGNLLRARSPAAWSQQMLSGLDNVINRLSRRREPDAVKAHPELLAALEGVLEGSAASAKELLEIAAMRATPQAQRLDLALRAVLRARGSPRTPRALSRVLHALRAGANGKRTSIGGYRNHSALWRIAVTG